MAEAIEEANQGLTRTLKDLFGGAVGGVAQVLIGTFAPNKTLCHHWPFDKLWANLCPVWTSAMNMTSDKLG